MIFDTAFGGALRAPLGAPLVDGLAALGARLRFAAAGAATASFETSPPAAAGGAAVVVAVVVIYFFDNGELTAMLFVFLQLLTTHTQHHDRQNKLRNRKKDAD